SAAGPQHGTATLGNAVEWYAVCAVFRPYPATPPVPPSTPSGLGTSSVASTRVALSWSPSSGSVAGYTVYRDGAVIGTTGPDTTIFLDRDVTPSTTHTYSVDAFDLVNDHSAPSAPLTVTTPAQSPEFVQGAAASPATRLPSYTLTLTEPVLAGDLLVGWFSQFDVSGEVRVSDDVNGPWTRSVSTTWNGTGDIALYYRENSAPAPSGLRITVSASASAYLQEVVADFRGVAAVGALDQAMVSQGVGTYASVGPTAPVPAGELVVAAVLTGGQPRWATPGSSERAPYLHRHDHDPRDDDHHQAVAPVRRAVSCVPRQLSARADVHCRRPPRSVRLPVSGALGAVDTRSCRKHVPRGALTAPRPRGEAPPRVMDPHRPCPVCGARRARALHRRPARRILRCACGLVFVDPLPSEA